MKTAQVRRPRAKAQVAPKTALHETLWQSWPTGVKALVLIASGATAAFALVGIFVSLADGVAKLNDSGPLPYAGRIEVQKTKEELSGALEQVLNNFKSLDKAQKVTTAELERRNIRALNTALETARLKAAESKSVSDQMLVDTLELQLERALDEAADSAAR